jgi:glutathione S-transferase
VITLYVDGFFVNQFDASCFIALTEKGLEFQIARGLLTTGSFPAALSKITGLPRVPALQHGDFWLTESSAIAEYLDEMFPAPAYPRLIPADIYRRARARQIMSFVRSDMWMLRNERPWWMTVYPATPGPLSPEAERDAGALVDLADKLVSCGELDEWNIAHADLALALLRLSRTGYPLPEPVLRFHDQNIERPSLRAYLEHPRPPHRPPAARSTMFNTNKS